MAAALPDWSSDAWRAEATAWLDDRLADAGLRRTGDVTQPHLRPWSTCLRAETTGGPVWLKATTAAHAFEVPLYGLLEAASPGRVLSPVAADAARGWIVLPDGGRSLADDLVGDELVDAMAAALPLYAELQRRIAPQADALVALGVPDMRLPVMPDRFDEALDVVRAYVARAGRNGDSETCAEVARRRPAFLEWCARLADGPGPASLDHNDLHPYNVLRPVGGDDIVFYDWGDSVVAHPFTSMLVALGFVQRHVLQVEADHPAVLRLRDAYLDGFADMAPLAELVATMETACRVAKVARALVWERAVAAADPDQRDPQWARGALDTMATLLDDGYLGGGT
jgi:Phosphotransferase enzyme family